MKLIEMTKTSNLCDIWRLPRHNSALGGPTRSSTETNVLKFLVDVILDTEIGQ